CRWNNARLLTIEINFGDLAEAEVVGPFGDFVDAESRADVVEKDVAGNFKRRRDADDTVTLSSPIAKSSAEEHGAARAFERRSRPDRSLGQAGDRHRGFEYRSGRVEPLDRAIDLRLERI